MLTLPFINDAKNSIKFEKTCKDNISSLCMFCQSSDLTYGISVTELITPASPEELAQT